MGEAGSGESANLWWFAATVGVAMMAQIGLSYRARIKVKNERENGHIDKQVEREVILENKDNRAFQYLKQRLDQCEAGHKSCDENLTKEREARSRWTQAFEMALFNTEVLAECLRGAGIPVPNLPKINRPG